MNPTTTTNHTHYFEVAVQCQNTVSESTVASSSALNFNSEPTPQIKEILTTEQSVLATLNSCLLSNFQMVAENSNFSFLSFKCTTVAKIELVGSQYTVTEILLNPTLTLALHQFENRAKKLLEMSKNACLKTGLVNAKVTLNPTINFE